MSVDEDGMYPARVGRVSLTGFSTTDLVAELERREECIASEQLKPPADIFPWYMVVHQFSRYYEIPGKGKILVVRDVKE